MNDFFEDLDRLEGRTAAGVPAGFSVERHLQVLADLGRDMSAALDLDDLVGVVLKRLVELTGADRGYLFFSGQGQEARFFKGVDRFGESLPPLERTRSKRYVTQILTSGAPGLRETLGERDQTRSLSVMVVPLESNRGRFGALYLEREGREGAQEAEDLLLARLVATQAAQAIELFRLEEERRRTERVRMENEFLRRLSRRQEEQGREVEALNRKLELRGRQLSETSIFLRGILDSSTEYAIIAVDPEGRISTFNSGATHIYGWAAEEVEGKETLAAFMPERDRQSGLLGKMMAGARGTAGRHAAEAVRLCKDKSEVPVRVAMTAIRNPAGEVVGFLDISSDVTAERALRRQLTMSEKMAALGTLSAGVAHEFNNILQGIIGFLAHALKKEDPELWKRAMRVSLDAANRASTITGRLQDFARPNVTGLRPVDLEQLVEETLALVERSFETDGVELVREYQANLPPVMADRSRLSQVILNIVTNARHAVMEASMRRVSLELKLEGPWIVLRVADSGCGIPEEHQDRIFEPFFTTKGALGGNVYDGKIHGTGLGLAISSGIVREHGGLIDLESQPGKGTVFTVKLKPSKEKHAELGRRPAALPSLPSKPARPLAVLVVDDESVVRELLREVLEARGNHVVTAAHGREGWERFQEGSFDVVVADYQMPGLDGVQLFAKICRQSGQQPLPRRILVTGRPQQGDSPPGCIQAFLYKPFDTARVLCVVEDLSLEACWRDPGQA